MKRKKGKQTNVTSFMRRVGLREIVTLCLVAIVVVLGIVIANRQLSGYQSKAAEGTLDCNGICAQYLPNSAVSTAGKAPCTQSCEKVKAEIEKGTPCKEACEKTLMGRRLVCQMVCDKAGIK